MKKFFLIYILLLIFTLEVIFTIVLLSREKNVEKNVLSGGDEIVSSASPSSEASPLVQNSLINLELKLFSDKTVYHSGDVLNLDFKITAADTFSNAKVVVEGILGRLNQEKNLDLKKGENNISFNYILPRCNVCGGITEGEYTILGKVFIGEKTKETSTKITILQ